MNIIWERCRTFGGDIRCVKLIASIPLCRSSMPVSPDSSDSLKRGKYWKQMKVRPPLGEISFENDVGHSVVVIDALIVSQSVLNSSKLSSEMLKMGEYWKQ